MLTKMKKIPWMAVILLACGSLVAQAREVSSERARIAAENYVRIIVARDGAWGDSDTPRILAVQPFGQGGRELGYFFPVEPVGHIIVSRFEEIPPILAYSTRSNADPSSEGGMMGFFKDRLERTMTLIEGRLGRPVDPAEDLAPVLTKNYRSAWGALTGPGFDASTYHEDRRTRSTGMDYQEGDTMIRTEWHQRVPYNRDCPNMGCDWSYGEFDSTAVVGCVATAGSQILKYWGWPPEGVGGDYADAYDYANMLPRYWVDGAGWFNDDGGDPVTEAQIAAVAEICAEFGAAVEMNYGCGGSSAFTSNVEGAIENHFRYDNECDWRRASDYTVEEWFDLMKNEFNQNRVIEYAGGPPSDHAIVCDGWREEQIGDDYMWIHGIYGNNEGIDDWYAIWNILSSEFSTEEMVREIYPDCTLGTTIDGTWNVPTYPYRYFDRDAHAANASFAAGHKLPIVRPGFLLTNSGTTSTDRIEFNGTTSLPSVIYMDGDPVVGGRALVRDGKIRINAGGQMAIY